MSARQRNRRRNELSQQIAAARKGAGFLEMITPAHAKPKVKLTEEELATTDVAITTTVISVLRAVSRWLSR